MSNFSPEQLDCIFADSAARHHWADVLLLIQEHVNPGAEDATPPVLNQLPYSLKSYDDKAVRENGKRNLAGTTS